MRVAALYDIHGNLPALEAVLVEVAAAGVERIVVGGDVVAGPMPRATLERLLDLDIPVAFVRGNADREVAARMAGQMDASLPAHLEETLGWVAEQLEREHARVLASWPLTLHFDVDGLGGGLGGVLFCHATPRSDHEVFTRNTPEARVAPAFAGVDAALVVCGHTHMPFDRRIASVRVVNAGSVGMPYGAPGAHWLLLGSDVDFRRTEYDREDAARRIRATAYPQAEDYAANNVLQPPSEAQALEVFERVAMGGDT